MAKRTTANRPIEDADLRQESVTQFPPAKPVKLDENGKFIPTPVVSVTVTPETAEVLVGNFLTLGGVIDPADADDVTILWSSADSDTATVDGSGRVQGIAEGEVVITATSKQDPTKTDTATITVTVPPVAVTGVTIAPKTATIKVGNTQQLTPTVLPANATNKAITYVSSDETKATVNSAGLVTGVAVGSATITVTTADGDKTDTAVITVEAAE